MEDLELIKKLENARFLMNESRNLKWKAVQNQKWEEAADHRDQERKYEKIVNDLKVILESK